MEHGPVHMSGSPLTEFVGLQIFACLNDNFDPRNS